MISEVTHGKEPDGFINALIVPHIDGTVRNGIITSVKTLYGFDILN